MRCGVVAACDTLRRVSPRAFVRLFCFLGVLWSGAGATPEVSAQSDRHPPRVLALRVGGKQVPPTELPLVLTRELSVTARAPRWGAVRWLDLQGRPIEPGRKPSLGGIRLEPAAPGVYELSLRAAPLSIVVVRSAVLSADGEISDRASPTRSVPPELVFGPPPAESDETTRLVVAGPRDSLPALVSAVSLNAAGTYADSSRNIPLLSSECPEELRFPGEDVVCASSPELRVVTDLAERRHPSIAGRALLGEIGGQLFFELEGAEVHRVPVLGPRALGPGQPGRHRVKIRAAVVSTFEGGPPAVGTNVEEAQAVLRDEIASASRMWGQCGVTLGDVTAAEVNVVDPPVLSMITVGCGRALPASGGTIRFELGGKEAFLGTHPGEVPASVAPRLAATVRKLGFSVRVFANARAGDAALASYDLVVSGARGEPAELDVPPSGLSDDPSLGVCRAHLDLADGLEHFDDLNAATGTPEERYLLRALSDDDPTTIELIVVPLFSGVGRIGESFIHTPGGSLEAALILDRTGVRAGARSFTLAHELGHVLLDLPGHPDDFGVDTPSSLMDADAADSTIFGPRRLSLEDCRRAFRQSGSGTRVPIIEAWPLPHEKSE